MLDNQLGKDAGIDHQVDINFSQENNHENIEIDSYVRDSTRNIGGLATIRGATTNLETQLPNKA